MRVTLIRALMRAIAYKHGSGRAQEDLDVEPKRPGFGIPEVEADRLIELDPGSTIHLPKPGHAWFDYGSSPMPYLVAC